MSIRSALTCSQEGSGIEGPLSSGDYPALFRAADTHAQDQQRLFFIVLGFELLLIVTATGISVVGSPLAWVAVLQATVLFAALGCAVFLFSTKPDRHWYTARAVAESVKTITWRYVMRAEPFDVDDAAAREQFRETLKEIVDQNQDVAGRFRTDLAGVQRTEAMEQLRRADFLVRKGAYTTGRIVEQQEWYARKSSMNSCRATRAFIFLVASLGLAGVFAIARVQFPEAPRWPTDLFVSLAIAGVAWIQAKRFTELAAAYSLAAVEISNIRLQADDVTHDGALSSFVGDAENAFSREHTQWAARKDI